MNLKCPRCDSSQNQIRRHGFFIRRSDGKSMKRFFCTACSKSFSQATYQQNFRQRKRWLHARLLRDFNSGVSMRRMALNYRLSRTTIARKKQLLATQCRYKNQQELRMSDKVFELQFDDLETFIHSRCKPLSLTLAVEAKTRKILSFQIAKMPCKGRLSRKSLRKYGPRPDQRRQARELLFQEILPVVDPGATILSDKNPHYPSSVKTFFPLGQHLTTKGGRSCATGHGELKSNGFDPIFSLNHTFAMCRYNLAQLVRKTWCTIKKMESFEESMQMFVWHHNNFTLKHPTTRSLN